MYTVLTTGSAPNIGVDKALATGKSVENVTVPPEIVAIRAHRSNWLFVVVGLFRLSYQVMQSLVPSGVTAITGKACIFKVGSVLTLTRPLQVLPASVDC